MNKGSYQTELDQFFRAQNRADVATQVVTKGALSKARKKLKHSAFIDLNQRMIEEYEGGFPIETWNDFHLLAVDGSTATLPDEEGIVEHFGVWKPNKGKPCPKARLSQMFDVLNRVTVDAIISPKGRGERDLAATHFMELMPNDLVLLDRGYPAFWLFQVILSMNANFCARMPISRWEVVQKFRESGKKEKKVRLRATHDSAKKCKEMGLETDPITVRLIRIELDTGETEVLATTLLDKNRYPYDIFGDLYHKRWAVEEDYKIMKCRIEIENFTGKSVRSVYQDFHARVFSKNLSAIIANSVKSVIEEKTAHRKHVYQINMTQMLSTMKHALALLFIRSYEEVTKIVSDIQKTICQRVEAVRPGRSFPRNHKINKKKSWVCTWLLLPLYIVLALKWKIVRLFMLFFYHVL